MNALGGQKVSYLVILRIREKLYTVTHDLGWPQYSMFLIKLGCASNATHIKSEDFREDIYTPGTISTFAN